jgi:phosphate transport system substrate-binding protein
MRFAGSFTESRLILAFLISLVIVLTCCTDSPDKVKNTVKPEKLKTLSISGSWDLYPLISELVIGFEQIYPNLRVNVVLGSKLKETADLSFRIMADENCFNQGSQLDWDSTLTIVPIASNAVLPIVNSANPYLVQLASKGISKQQLRYIFVESTLDQWGQLLEIDSSFAIHPYIRTDISNETDSWSSFLRATCLDMVGLGVYGDQGMINGIMNDRYGIGYASLRYIYDTHTQLIRPGLTVIPMDLNNDGRINKAERIYGTFPDISYAIRHNSLPSPPVRTVCIIANKRPVDDVILNFIQWIFENGEYIIESSGFVRLDESLVKMELEKIEKLKNNV